MFLASDLENNIRVNLLMNHNILILLLFINTLIFIDRFIQNMYLILFSLK